MKPLRELFTEINKRIFNHRDGEIREMHKEYGATYKKSLGVPIVFLESIASDYAPSHELARLFWEFGGREQTIMAAMLEEPDKVEVKELEANILVANTPELWEQITRQLLRRLPDIDSYIHRWLNDDEEVLHIFAILSLGYLPNLFSTHILQSIMRIEVRKGSYLEKCMQRVLLKVGVRDKKVYQMMNQNLKMRTAYASLLQEIADFYE
ncbi:hypothetical protein C7377_0120 [Balneicella halophila]|uniref:DNA alkylation repair enzyme n=1 Tax=Balneicella halophila TaxID=1537566 RepID=A0A7L4UQW6_BALHA|nr:hypothetical protein [Balneicella halophila]PVX51831.1 hypothetical protein C7377_0120 [Balneicella halophila]